VKTTKPKLPKLLKEADRVFSLFIRGRDGYKCVICGSDFRPQNGHLITRKCKAIRFDEVNCNCQCQKCNYKHRYQPQFYDQWFLHKYGQKEFDRLTELSKVVYKFTVKELQEIINKYQ
jgi:rubredoxin